MADLTPPWEDEDFLQAFEEQETGKPAGKPIEPEKQKIGSKAETFNEGQMIAYKGILDIVAGEDTSTKKVAFIGYAGTGKTYTISGIVEDMKQIWPKINIGVTAPTHKAVRVLRKQSEMKNLLDFGTVHSFFNLKETIDQKTGKVSFKPDFTSEYGRRIDGINVLIVDETSMLQDDLFEIIEDEQRSRDLIVIYIGDPLQIPPVGKLEQTGEGMAIPLMPVRQQSHKIKVFELTEPQRQAKESPIIMYAHTIRENVKMQKVPWAFIDDHKEHLELISMSDPNSAITKMRELFKEYFDTEAFEADPDYAKVVAWRNDTVRYFNTEIRRIIFKREDLPKVLLGEKMIMDEPIIVGKKVALSKNEEIVINRVEVETIKVGYKYKAPTNAWREAQSTSNSKEFIEEDFKVYSVDFTTGDGKVFKKQYILHEDETARFENIKDKLKNAALKATDKFDKADMWKSFYDLPKKFIWVNYNYAITAHKAQGSTYNYTISMEWDIHENRNIEERNRIAYVAATRAKHKLWVVK